MLKVQISNRQETLEIPVRRLKKLLQLAAPCEWNGAEISLALVDGAQMTLLNRRYTEHDDDTDVLAFPLEDPADRLIGEIVVSVSRAVAEAKARGVAAEDELALYILHGALHLMGFDDHTPADRRRMYARERELLQRAGIPDVRQRPRRRAAQVRHRAFPKLRRKHKES